jgi:hypothetical protein
MSHHTIAIWLRHLCLYGVILSVVSACTQSSSSNSMNLPSAAVTRTAATAQPLPTAEPSPVPTAPPAAQTPSLADRWLIGLPCQAPCWEQIVPGTTTLTEAQQHLSQQELIRNIQQAPGRNNDPALIGWNWEDSPIGRGSLIYYENKPPFSNPPLNTVLNVSLVFDRPVTLREVIAAYGEPSHVQLAADYSSAAGLMYYFSVVYLERGFLLERTTTDFAQRPHLSEEMTFDFVVMYQPDSQGFDLAVEPYFPIRQPSQYLTPWQGIDADILVYCREIRQDAPQKGCQSQ